MPLRGHKIESNHRATASGIDPHSHGRCRSSSVVERTLGKGEVGSSILPCGTIFSKIYVRLGLGKGWNLELWQESRQQDVWTAFQSHAKLKL